MPTSNEIKKNNWWVSLLTTEVLILLLLMIGSLVVFAMAADMVFVKKKTDFDEAVFEAVGQQVTPIRTKVMVFISFLGKHTFLIPANFILLGYFLFKKKRWFSIRIAALALTSLSLMFILKLFFQRARPDIPLLEKVSGYSFPSGHALMGLVFYGLLIYIVWHEVSTRWLRMLLIVLLALLIVSISFSRIYLRVHYASDVIAGLAMGFAWLMLSLWIIGKMEKRHAARKVVPITA